ncbi:MAG: response regulator transcription factor [Proteobacteria bacterium]|nr:response regulator transcription factor [Pseudomonadota bacterium]
MRVVIAEDEAIARERLALALACVPEAELVGAASTGAEAIALIRETQPDIAVLDIQMPRGGGLEVAERIRSDAHLPELIFLTAYSEHAIKAFELNAADYLLKPVPFERLREALRRAQARLLARTSDERFAELERLIDSLRRDEPGAPAHKREVWVRERNGLTRLALETVRLMTAEGDYILMHSEGGSTHMVKDTMSAMEQRLDPTMFLRIHRSTIVNLSAVRQVVRRPPKGLAVVLDDGRQITVGPSYADAAAQQLQVRRWRLK